MQAVGNVSVCGAGADDRMSRAAGVHEMIAAGVNLKNFNNAIRFVVNDNMC